MLNRIILIGRLTQDPELRYTPSGTPVAHFTLAVDRPRLNQMGERETDFINIVVWQKLGELCAQYLRKGRLAAVEGRLQIRSYENREGQRVRVAEVVADNVRFLDRAGDREGGPSAPPASGSGWPEEARTRSTGMDDPFEGDATRIDISEDDLPF
ncbi:single-stranded DNA-binding protein [Kyrpidia spormannii]|uniref:Single-stranded DNA-binding protein n=2 Tax=Kyrpidia spormannii TaxID=2055160 RepID=A0A2K8NB11_9BACL|nr:MULTISPECIES: single-stranded DNA-binding protein [Kyrpidia]ATY86305.1 single-stranded DNA-binding protein [Kyrpidia spormannii]MCL6576873.1 single-stranded DNA-binding protein [Kyrpidia sp.]CAB3395843.1 single-strand DNA-binding protein [Kyrpidia spormannii]CAB3396347.1 single-strand DNA-binding protein [Kyrpidia spormannii]